MMNIRSETELAKVMPDFAAKVRAAAGTLEAQGTFLLVVSGFRNAAEQNADYAQGRTTPGHIITRARAGESMHNYGLAADIAPYKRGNGGDLNWSPGSPQFKAMVEAMKEQGLEWGGDWPGTLGDDDHFQYPGMPRKPTPTMQADFLAISVPNAATQISSIWGKALAGEYDTA